MKRRKETNYIVLHHSESPGGGIDFLRQIHLQRGWADVGYHFAILCGKNHGDWLGGNDGEAQEGRAIELTGAHARGLNGESIGICLIGDFMYAQPTDRQITTLIGLLARLCTAYNLDPLKAIIAHRDVNDTDCPGDYLYSILSPPYRLIQYAVYYRMKIMEGGE